MNSEDFFIKSMRRHSRAIGDDGAVKGEWVYSKDAFFENIHFRRAWMRPFHIAQKAMLVNLSDAIAMNATPMYALLAVAMPKSISRSEMEELASGFIQCANAFGVEIIGGDTIANSKLDISVTIVSYTKKPLMRTGIKTGDFIAYTGTLGLAKRHLDRLLRGGRVHTRSRFHALTLRQHFIQKSRRYLRAGMDISDGLFSDLQKLSAANRCGFRLFEAIPASVGCSGEEYEMLVAFDRRAKKALLRRSRQSRTPLRIIGEAKRGHFISRCKQHHF
ncbi:MAG: thiamine-phosphate kinase [Campylobacterales bacterium]|nr:thiamine-phosphate kinase [Campylobacterales bacterium]